MTTDLNTLYRHRLPKLHNSYRLKTAVSIINQDVLPQYYSVGNIEDLQLIVYSATVAVVQTLGLRTYPQGDSKGRPCSKAEKPAWMRRLENRINETRTKIGRLKDYQRGNRTVRVVRQIAEIVKPKKLRDFTDANITEIFVKRLRRYAEC